MPSPDVLILGGGVIGLTTAYFLARDGVRVTVVDKGDFGQESSWAGAGIISPGNPKRARTAIGQLRARSAAMFPELSAELHERTGIDNGYWRCGGLELRRSDESLEKQRLQNLVPTETVVARFQRAELRHVENVPPQKECGEGVHCDVLDATQLHEREPLLSPALSGAVLFPEMAQVRNPRHVQALVAACTALHVELLRDCSVNELEGSSGRIIAAKTTTGRLTAERFLVTSGAWTDQLLAGMGVELGIRPIRGQIVLLQPATPMLHHILLVGDEYLVPRRWATGRPGDGPILVGSTQEDVGFDRHTTAVGVRALLDMALGLVPALSDVPVERCWAGLRPGSPDGKPFLGPVPGFENLFVAAGHFRSGIQNSPGTGQIMTELLTGKPTSLPLDAFRLDRLSAISPGRSVQPGSRSFPADSREPIADSR
jgi:glycine oxidase